MASLAIFERKDGLTTFFKSIPHSLIFELYISVHPFQAAISLLQLFQPGHHGSVHAAILRPPLVKGRATHAMLAAKLRHGNTALRLFQNRQNLTVREP